MASTGGDPAATVRHLAETTRKQYHDATLAARIADHLLARLADGAFSIADSQALARALNAEIATVSRDAHFVVMAGAMADMRAVPPSEPHQPTPPLKASELAVLDREKFGFPTAEILSGNVGRIEVQPQFYRPAAEIRAAAAAAMEVVAPTSALIIDLTRTIGGDPRSVAFFLSYFFDRPEFVVNRFRWRSLPVEEFSTTRRPGGPLYGESRPVAVLVSRSSYSAAEEFAYDMQALRRGIIVGQKTPGAANHALPVQLVGGFTAFVPMARAENPVTGTNWEGVGVTPDVAADPPTVEAARQTLLARVA